MPISGLSHLGARVSFDLDGSGPAIVLLHAGGSSSRQWRKVGSFLNTEFTLVAPDFWGCGNSDPWPGPDQLTHENQAQLVAKVIQSVDAQSCLVVGHSYGGATALRLALSNPNLVSGLILIEPIVMPLLKESNDIRLFEEYESMAQEFLARASQNDIDGAWQIFLDYRNGRGTWEGLTEKARDRFRGDTQSAVKGFHANLDNPTAVSDLQGLDMPTAVICGEQTTLPDRRVSEIVSKSIVDCQFHEIEGAGHMSPLSHPDSVAGLISDFFRSL